MENENNSDVISEKKTTLEDKTKKTFEKVAETLYDNTVLQEDLYTRLLKVSNTLKVKTVSEDELMLSELDLISINGLISKEERIRKEEMLIQKIVPCLIILYILLISVVISFSGDNVKSTTEVPLLGVPVTIVLWAAIGSLAAILYRFYTQKPERMSTELKWLIARPIIGIIMGSLAYLAVLSGLVIFSTNTEASGNINPAKPQLLWMLAFLGGFSDKFFETLIHSVMGKVSVTNNKSNS
jgi:hypothetical protein